MALVITLIMLAVTLVMAMAFIALSRRQRDAVSTTTDTAMARLATDSALAMAEAQIAANITSSTNLAAYNQRLLVSTNYEYGYGFNRVGGPNGSGPANPTNVNYDLYNTGVAGPLSPVDQVQNIANLLYLPRAPVYIRTNNASGGYGYDFRYYLDLNRNGRFETNGWVVDLDNLGRPVVDAKNNYVYHFETGDPEWVGVLEHPDQPHGPNNPFIARYAFMAQPIGNSLDLNAIHNQVLNQTLSVRDGYVRNQGVGTWELNLAAFLADLNTNEWDSPTSVNPTVNPYIYFQPNIDNKGSAFEDARALLSWRYGYRYNSLASVNQLFPNNSFNGAFAFDNIDGYGDGPWQITVNTNADVPRADNASLPWAGAESTNQFYNLPSDLFNPAMSASSGVNSFTNRLMQAGLGKSTYDRYTFYRLMAQLGTASEPESGKINLNYSNAVVRYNNYGVVTGVTIIPGAETNQVPWRPRDFFVAAADQMLRLYSEMWFRRNPSNYLSSIYGINTNYYHRDVNFNVIANDPSGLGLTNLPYFGMTNEIPVVSITNIPVRVNGQYVYSPAVNRILQLAANLYEASTNEFYPNVYRPMFEHDRAGNAFVVGYTNPVSGGLLNTVVNEKDHQLDPPFDDYSPAITNIPPLYQPIQYLGQFVNVYGVPWIIGARKGFPNFNKLGMQTVVEVTRKLQVGRKPGDTSVPTHLQFTNQLYSFSISNSIGVECWNSYTNAYPNPVYINVRDTLSMAITNDYGLPPRAFSGYVMGNTYYVGKWPGYANNAEPSFKVPLQRSAILLTNADLYFGSAPPGVAGFYPDSFNYGWETNRTSFDLPNFTLLTTNRFQLSMLDFSNGVYHVIDYVHFNGPNKNRYLSSVLKTTSSAPGYDNMWSVFLKKNSVVPVGIDNQWNASIGSPPYRNNQGYWNGLTGVTGLTPQEEIDGFKHFLGLALGSMNPNYYTTNSVVQLPYTPTAMIYDYTGWQANDPLVHYLASDLNYTGSENKGALLSGLNKIQDNSAVPMPRYTVLNERYQPWGKAAPIGFDSLDYNFTNAWNAIYKDPLVTSSDGWNFPTNKYPTEGWIGRVHRGTPWQTVYLKSQNVLHQLQGNRINSGTNTWLAWTGDYDVFDAANSAPLLDRMLFDVFTTGLNPNSTRGQLSVNQDNLAAWSAVFSGMEVLSNNVKNARISIDPATFANLVIQPAGLEGDYSTLNYLVTNINSARAIYTNADGVVGTFEEKGDILSVPALTDRSPYLNRSSRSQLNNGISDQVYEWLPQQMMSLLSCPSAPRYLVTCYGQALKPAQNSTVLSGNYFKMVTNYQVVAESAIRAVIRLDKHVTATGTNYTTAVESYNVLPPD